MNTETVAGSKPAKKSKTTQPAADAALEATARVAAAEAALVSAETAAADALAAFESDPSTESAARRLVCDQQRVNAVKALDAARVAAQPAFAAANRERTIREVAELELELAVDAIAPVIAEYVAAHDAFKAALRRLAADLPAAVQSRQNAVNLLASKCAALGIEPKPHAAPALVEVLASVRAKTGDLALLNTHRGPAAETKVRVAL